VTRYEVNGIGLNVETTGDGPPLLLLHGFTGSGATWTPHLPALAPQVTAVAVDLIGHGGSDAPVDPLHYRMDAQVRDLWGLADALGFAQTPIGILGYSMGARVALQMTAAAPARVSRLILEGGTPGLADDAARRARRAADERLAFDIELRGVEPFVDSWEAQPLFATQQQLPAEVRQALRQERLRNTPAGLANSVRCNSVGAQRSLWDRLDTVAMPALLIAGALDPKFADIATATAARMPAARLAIVPGAGHAVHLEQPQEFDRLVVDFLEGPTASINIDSRRKDACPMAICP